MVIYVTKNYIHNSSGTVNPANISYKSASVCVNTAISIVTFSRNCYFIDNLACNSIIYCSNLAYILFHTSSGKLANML